VSLSIYVATLAPGLTWAHDSGDGGELATAASSLGIPHPPGYPTYVMLAHLFTLLPTGEVAGRTNLFSAVCAAGMAALLVWTLMQRRGNGVAAAGAGLALAFSPLLWSQATVTEVHALNGLFAALLLALATREPGQHVFLRSLVVGVAWGLGLGNHPTVLFCAPLVFLSLRRLRRAWMIGMVGVGLGLAVYLYLPLRAATDPPLNWGDPQTLRQFWWVVSGTPYRRFVFSLPLVYLPTRLLAWMDLVTAQFTWLGLAVAVIGATTLWTENRPLLGATGTTAALCSMFALGYDTSDSYLYLLPALACAGYWLGTGADWLVAVLAARSRWMSWVAGALVIVLPLAAAACRFPAQDLSDDRAAYEFREAVLDRAPAGAVIVSQRDRDTFTSWYFQYTTGYRSDVVVVDADLIKYDWYAASLSRRLVVPWPTAVFQAGGDESLQGVAEILGRPACRISREARLLCVEKE
jgi:hypothetical protein